MVVLFSPEVLLRHHTTTPWYSLVQCGPVVSWCTVSCTARRTVSLATTGLLSPSRTIVSTQYQTEYQSTNHNTPPPPPDVLLTQSIEIPLGGHYLTPVSNIRGKTNSF